MTIKWGKRTAPHINEVWEFYDNNLWLIIEDVRYGRRYWKFDAFCLTTGDREIIHVMTIADQRCWERCWKCVM